MGWRKKALRDEKSSPAFHWIIRGISRCSAAPDGYCSETSGYDFEVFNDLDGNLVNLYRCVAWSSHSSSKEIRYLLNSRLDFEHMKRLLHERAALPRRQRGAYYYALIRYSYAAGDDLWRPAHTMERLSVDRRGGKPSAKGGRGTRTV